MNIYQKTPEELDREEWEAHYMNLGNKLSVILNKHLDGEEVFPRHVWRVALDNAFKEPWELNTTSPAYKTLHIKDLKGVCIQMAKYKNPRIFLQHLYQGSLLRNAYYKARRKGKQGKRIKKDFGERWVVKEDSKHFKIPF